MTQALGAEGPIWATLPIAKFSHVMGHPGRRFPPWAHISTKNLTLVIEAIRVVDEHGSYDRRVVMKISAGAEVLESQDLGQLVQLYRQTDASTDPERIVEVQFTSPRLAMRYPKSVENIQKIQVRFQNDLDFTKVVNIITDLGLPIKPAASSKISRPLASPALLPPSGAPTPINQQTAQSQPASAFSSLNHNTSFGLLSSSPYMDFKIPERPATAEVQRNIPTYSPQPCRPTSVAPPISPPSRASPLHQSAKPLYLPQMERESQTSRVSQPISQDFCQDGSGRINDQFGSAIFLRQMQAQREDIAERIDSTSRLISATPFFTSLSTSRRAAPELPDPFLGPDPHISQRPASTPADIQDLFIPPRRELPFVQPEPKPRPSSAIDFSALPKPTPVSKSSPKKAIDNENTHIPAPKAAPIKRVAQRKGPLPRSTQTTVSEEGPPIKPLTRETIITPPLPRKDQLSPLAAKSAAVAASRSASSTLGLVSKASAPSKKRTTAPIRPPSSDKRPKVVDQGTQTQPSPGNDHVRHERAPRRDDISDLIPDIGNTVSTPDSYLNALDAFVAKHKARPAAKEFWQMPGYADADAEHRQMILNDFICENLENPDFLQLCVDTETAWRRIGLGM